MSDRLRTAIRDSGFSLAELGRRSGVDHSRLSRFLRGERDINLAAAETLCGILGLQLVATAPKSEVTGQAEKPAKGNKSPEKPTTRKPKKEK
jgi:transcriptional regulator with XRE-family HTH domain